MDNTGATMDTLVDETSCTAGNENACWTLEADTPGNRGFQLQLSLDESWSFESSANTTLKIEIRFNCDTLLQYGADLVIAFVPSDNNVQFFANLITLGSFESTDDEVYPQCSTGSSFSRYANGDVMDLVSSYSTDTRWEKLSGTDGENVVLECDTTSSDTLMLTLHNIPNSHMEYMVEKPGADPVECAFTASSGIGDIYFGMNDFYTSSDSLNIEYVSVFKSYVEPTTLSSSTSQPGQSTSFVDSEQQNLIKTDSSNSNHGALTTVIVFLAILLSLTLCGIGAYWAHRREVMVTMKSMVRTMSYHPNQVGFDKEMPHGEFGPNLDDESPEPSLNLVQAAPQHMMATNGLMVTAKMGDSSDDDDARSDDDIASLTTPYNGTFGSRTPVSGPSGGSGRGSPQGVRLGSNDRLSLGTNNMTNFGTQSIGISEMGHTAYQHAYGSPALTAASGRSVKSGMSAASGVSGVSGVSTVSGVSSSSTGSNTNYGARLTAMMESGLVPVNKRSNVPYANITKKQFKILQSALKKCRTPSDFQRLGSMVKSGQVPDHEIEDIDELEQEDAAGGHYDYPQGYQQPVSDVSSPQSQRYSQPVSPREPHQPIHHPMGMGSTPRGYQQAVSPHSPVSLPTRGYHQDYQQAKSHRVGQSDPEELDHDIDLSESDDSDRDETDDTTPGPTIALRNETTDTQQSTHRRESSLDKEDLSNRLEVLAKLEPLPALRTNLHQSRMNNGY